jgi:dihydroorotate dehydrogenase (fumarate)
LYGTTKASVCANTGIFSGKDAIKMILAGAAAVQVVSTLYLNQISVIEKILMDINKWMDSKGYDSIDSFRGKLSNKNTSDQSPYYRNQYYDFQMSTSAILKKYRVMN